MRRRTFVKILGALSLSGFRKKRMTHDDYCINVCGGKCCKYAGSIESRCPNLGEDNRCQTYAQWRNGTCGHKRLVQIGVDKHEVETMPIKEALKRGLVPDWIKEQCCYAHPELLDI